MIALEAFLLVAVLSSDIEAQTPGQAPSTSPVPSPVSAPSACRPAPYEDCGQATFDTSPTRRWGFDDNHYCPQGPGIGCIIPNRGFGQNNPNPGTDFVDGRGCVFEMYVVADCGTQMHIPLCDVESAKVRVLDPLGVPVDLQAVNGAVSGQTCTGQQSGIPFQRRGTQIEWSATDCDPSDGSSTGGPGNFTIMDISFTGDDDSLPGGALCGVYTLQLEDFAGCGWELFSNCDGSNRSDFLIYDDRCEAEAAVTPLPELVLTNLRLDVGPDRCTVDYCVNVQNIGCEEPLPFPLVVEEQVSGNRDEHEVPGLGPGEVTTICGTLPVDSTDPTVVVPVRAEVDPVGPAGDQVVECREVPQASSCNPSEGQDVLSDTIEVECNQPPACDAGGPYVQECTGTETPVPLDGSGSFDPDGDPLDYEWTTDCPGTIQDPASPQTELLFDSTDLGCSKSCEVTLTVSDPYTQTVCDAPVTVEDTQPPGFTNVPEDLPVECSAKGGTPASHPAIQAWRDEFEGADACGGLQESDDMPPFFDGSCAPGTGTPVTVTLTDGCGLQETATRSVIVADTTPPFWVEAPGDLTLECQAPGGTPSDIPEVQAWRDEFVADDVCHPVTDRDDMPPFFPAGCAPGEETPVTVTATDACDLETPITRSVFVQDTTPPVIEAISFDGACLWPPNHKYVCLEDMDALVDASDICDPDPSVRVTGCSSDQPEDAKDPDFPGDNGDGKTFDDCLLEDGGRSLCLRSERLGTDPTGRDYAAEVGAFDGCQNTTTGLANVHVPHDQSPRRRDCLSPDSPGRR